MASVANLSPELTDMRDEPDSTWTLLGDDGKASRQVPNNWLLRAV